MDTKSLKGRADQWLSDWNQRDINKIMSHYADDVVFYSPTVRERWHINDGRLTGKQALEKHFLKGLALAPDLHFEPIEVMEGTDGILTVYKRENGKTVADYMIPNEEGKVKTVMVFST